MQAMRLFSQQPVEENPLRLCDIAQPEPAANQVRLRVNVCGVCRTDLHIVEGDIHPPALPLTPGHQVVGVIDALAEGVSRLQIGQRVGVPWLHKACGVCEFCRRGEENLCPQAQYSGFQVQGGFAQWMLADADYVLPLPENVDDEQAAPLLCAGIIGYRSLKKADLSHGERLGLFGFGASAHLAIQVARHWECSVYVFTRSEQHRRHAEELGAVWCGTAHDTPPQPLDRAVIFAPAGELVPLAMQKLRSGGTLAINAIHMSDIPHMPYALLYGERTLRSVANATYQDGIEFLHLAAAIPLRVDTNPYDLQDANHALQELKHSRLNGEAVLRIYDSFHKR